MSKEKIILGIDPGTTIMGFGLIKIVGKKMEFMQLNELMLKKYDDHYLKLKLIKMAITGNGNASKEQVAKMLQSMLGLKTLPKNLDSMDGLAAAVCHFYNQGRVEIGKSYSGWGAFVKQNENRVKK